MRIEPRWVWVAGLSLTLGAAVGGCGRSRPKPPKPDETVVFKEVDGNELLLHVFRPKGIEKGARAPVVLLYHGGGWLDGEPSQMFPQCEYFADRGLLAISGQYRLLSTHGTTPFESVKDCKSAIAWLRKHAGELGGDPNVILAGGMSAGGHIPLCSAMFPEIRSEDEDPNVNYAPEALLMWNPVVDATMTGYEHGAKRLGDRAEDISPVHHMRPGLPPSIILHATGDTCTPYENVVRYTKLAREAGNKVVLFTFEGRRHGFGNHMSVKPYIKDNDDFERACREVERFLVFLGHLDPQPIPEKK